MEEIIRFLDEHGFSVYYERHNSLEALYYNIILKDKSFDEIFEKVYFEKKVNDKNIYGLVVYREVASKEGLMFYGDGKIYVTDGEFSGYKIDKITHNNYKVVIEHLLEQLKIWLKHLKAI